MDRVGSADGGGARLGQSEVPDLALLNELLDRAGDLLDGRHPRIEVEVVVEDRFVDIVAEGYDAGVRLSEAIQRDMVQVPLTDSFRFVVVGAPSYLARHGTPER